MDMMMMMIRVRVMVRRRRRREEYYEDGGKTTDQLVIAPTMDLAMEQREGLKTHVCCKEVCVCVTNPRPTANKRQHFGRDPLALP